MSRPAAVHLASAVLVLGALATWLATGHEGYTRLPNEKLAAADAPVSEAEADLLAEIGFEDDADAEAGPDIESRFALGLVPGGADPPHLLSVATCAALGLGLSALAWWRARRPSDLATP